MRYKYSFVNNYSLIVKEIMLKEIMIEGINCLHNRDHPLVVREKLNTFVPMSERKKEDISKK